MVRIWPVIRRVAGIVVAASTLPALAQTSGAGMHGHDSADWQNCKKQADDRGLPQGLERQKLMHSCMQGKHGAADAEKSAAARAKMGDPQSGHLHSDPPPATPTAPNP
jgi:hypothetical protein